MKSNEKDRSKSKKNQAQKKCNNNNNTTNNENPFYPIKYLCFNEVKKIVNNKNKKSPISNKNNEKPKNINKKEKLKKEEEDSYNKSIYNKKAKIFHNLSSSNLIKRKLNINKIEKKKIYENKWASNDDRCKAVNKFGFYTKKIFNINKIQIANNLNSTIKKYKFSKKTRKIDIKTKIRNKNYNILDIHDINNICNNNDIYKSNNINESNITLTSNTITSKTITNNTMSNYTISNITPNSYYNKTNNTNNNMENISHNKENNSKNKKNKINNIKVIKNKGRNKNIKNKNIQNNEKENTVFIRRIILEEKFTIDSKGDKKTIYIKKISPIIKKKEILNSADKRLIKNKKIIKNNNYSKKDNTFINHNDINLNFNVCSFQKINLNNNTDRKNNIISWRSKIESFDDDNKLGINNNTSLNDAILQNYKDFLNIKNCNKIIYQKPNGILYKNENHKSYQSLFPSPNKRYFIYSNGKDNSKKKSKIQKKEANNSNNCKSHKNNTIKKCSTKEYKSYNNPLKKIMGLQRFLKNKMVHRKTKTNVLNQNNVDYDDLKLEENAKDDSEDTLSNKRSLSFVGNSNKYNIKKKVKDKPKLEIKEKFKNGNIIFEPTFISPDNQGKKINGYLCFSSSNSGMTSKTNTKMNSINNSKYLKQINQNNKPKIYININDNNNANNNCQRYHSLKKCSNKNNFNSNQFKLFDNHLKNNMISNSGKGRNKSHRNFQIKKYTKFNLDNLIIKNKKINSNRSNYSNLIYKKSKANKQITKK